MKHRIDKLEWIAKGIMIISLLGIVSGMAAMVAIAVVVAARLVEVML